jgi:hypothetical protein
MGRDAVVETGTGWLANVAMTEVGRLMAKQMLPDRLRSIARRVALALCLAIPLTGCIKSHGPLLPEENASTPLPAGRYFTLSKLNSPGDLPTVQGPFQVRIRGTGYVATPTEPGEMPLRFHLVRLAAASGVYILQTVAQDKQGYRDILIGVVGGNGFCSKDIRNFPPAAVVDQEIVSAPILLRWLTENATEIAASPNDVCFVRKS